MITRIYTNPDGLKVFHSDSGWVAECEHRPLTFNLKREAMLASCDCKDESAVDPVVQAEAGHDVQDDGPAPFNLCRCGCGEHVAPKRSYRPGHDARHAGAVARALIADDRDREAESARAFMSGALRAKVDRIRRAARKDS